MALKNTFDEAGILHNDMLDYIIAQNTTPTYEEFEGYCVDFISTLMDDNRPIFQRAAKTMVAQAYNFALFENTIGYDREELIYNNFKANGEQLKFLKRLLDPTTEPPPVGHYETIQSDILSSSLTEAERAPLLAAVSIAIHSIEYWTDASTNPENPWYPDWGPTIAVGSTGRADYLTFLGRFHLVNFCCRSNGK